MNDRESAPIRRPGGDRIGCRGGSALACLPSSHDIDAVASLERDTAPVGDHSTLLALPRKICRSLVPFGRMRQMPPKQRLLAKAISRPSGDQSGSVSIVTKETQGG